MLRAGGFQLPAVESFPFVLEFDSPEAYWAIFTEVAAGMKAKLATLPAAEAARLREDVAGAARTHLEGGRIRLTATMLCGIAEK